MLFFFFLFGCFSSNAGVDALFEKTRTKIESENASTYRSTTGLNARDHKSTQHSNHTSSLFFIQNKYGPSHEKFKGQEDWPADRAQFYGWSSWWYISHGCSTFLCLHLQRHITPQFPSIFLTYDPKNQERMNDGKHTMWNTWLARNSGTMPKWTYSNSHTNPSHYFTHDVCAGWRRWRWRRGGAEYSSSNFRRWSDELKMTRGHWDLKKRPGVDFFFSWTLRGLTNYVIRHQPKYSNMTSSSGASPSSLRSLVTDYGRRHGFWNLKAQGPLLVVLKRWVLKNFSSCCPYHVSPLFHGRFSTPYDVLWGSRAQHCCSGRILCILDRQHILQHRESILLLAPYFPVYKTSK